MAYSANPVDKKIIYQSRDVQGNSWNIDGIGAQDGYKSGTCPSQEMVDAYETVNGMTVLNLANPYLDDKHLQPNYNTANTMYDPQDPYANRDPRFYASVRSEEHTSELKSLMRISYAVLCLTKKNHKHKK